jgi:hypothetical protein
VADDRVSLPTLVMTGGPLDGTAYTLPVSGREVTVGSGMDADVQIMLGNVEPFHARISFSSTGISISDAGSATGTFVNGEKIEETHPLQDGDRLCLGPPGAKGSAKLLVRLPGAPSASPSLEAPALALPSLDGDTPSLALEGETIDIGRDSPVVGGSGPTLEVGEAGAESDDEPLFASPLPPSPAPPRSAPPPPPAPPAPPPPPPPAPARSERVTAPAPAEPAAPRPAAKPEWETDLPSIPIESPASSPRHSDFPPLRPSAKAPARGAKARGRPAPRRRRSISLPILPILGGLAGLGLVAGLVWFFFLRPNPPVVASIAPTQAETDQTVTLAGRNFADGASGNTVLFGTARATVTSASATELKVLVPAGVKGSVPVVVQTPKGRSSPVSLTVAAVPTVTAVEPDVAMPGQTVLIKGDNLDARAVKVEFGGTASSAVEVTPQGIRAAVPVLSLPEGSRTTVVVRSGSNATRPREILIGHLPLVTEVSPRRGMVGDRVVVKGRGFQPDLHGNAVTFGGQPALVLGATAAALTVVAPAPAPGDVQPELPVVVTTGGRTSSANIGFQLTRGNTSSFLPRFFAAEVPEYPAEGYVFVSTELGPVLLLGGRAEAGSTAERAVAVAEALNRLVTGAQSRPPAFELRERPQPSVAVVGEVRPFLAPTAEDAAAYSKPWEGGKGGRRVTTAMLARHWAALLQDYFGLFLYRQRPLRMVSVSPRGRVLTEIYGEASRRAPGGNGIPSSLVLPTPAGMAAQLRQLALVVSTESGTASVAMEGRWSGTIEDPDLGTRSFQVEVRREGGRLLGTLTTWRGKVELKSPLRDLGFDQGKVRFTADLQGAPNVFSGTLDGNSVSGTIDRRGRSAARFTLQFEE